MIDIIVQNMRQREIQERAEAFRVYRDLLSRDGELTAKQEALLVDAMRTLGRRAEHLAGDQRVFLQLAADEAVVALVSRAELCEEHKRVKAEAMALAAEKADALASFFQREEAANKVVGAAANRLAELNRAEAAVSTAKAKLRSEFAIDAT